MYCEDLKSEGSCESEDNEIGGGILFVLFETEGMINIKIVYNYNLYNLFNEWNINIPFISFLYTVCFFDSDINKCLLKKDTCGEFLQQVSCDSNFNGISTGVFFS